MGVREVRVTQDRRTHKLTLNEILSLRIVYKPIVIVNMLEGLWQAAANKR